MVLQISQNIYINDNMLTVITAIFLLFENTEKQICVNLYVLQICIRIHRLLLIIIMLILFLHIAD